MPLVGCWRLRHDGWMTNRCELLTVAETREADRLTIARGTPGFELMLQAGRAVAEDVMERVRVSNRPIVVLCGPGNNGGDGFVAAHVLHAAGYPVTLGLLGQENALRGDAAQAARHWGRGAVPFSRIELDGAAAVVDAIFGAGLSRDLDGEARDMVERVNAWARQTRLPVIAVDVPSGIDGDTGHPCGVAIEASATVTFFRRKPGHLLLPGRLHCGEVEVEDIGIDDDVLANLAPRTFAGDPPLWLSSWPVPSVAGHKYSRGHAVVVSGSAWHTGAARLSARGALRAGAGLVTLASPTDALAVNAAHLTAIMLAPADGTEGLRAILSDHRKNVVVIGPGLGSGEPTRALVAAALRRDTGDKARSFVLDADALTAFADSPEALRKLVRAATGSVVLTPHDGEFARLFSALHGAADTTREVDETLDQARPASKLERARHAATWCGAIIVLKGADTVIAHPDGRAAISSQSAPWLATAGSGDVLAGMIGGLLAQGMPAFEAATAAVWMHARAAHVFGPGLISEDIPDALPAVIADLATQAVGGGKSDG